MNKLSSIAYYVTDKISSNDIALSEYITTDCILQNKKGREIATNLPPQPCCLTRYQHGDVLIANIRPYLKKVWFADIDGGASSDVLVFRAKEGHSPSFLYAVLLQDSFFDYVMQGAKGSKMPRGDKEQILRYEMPTLSCSEESIGTFFLNLDQKIRLNEQINQNLEAMAKQLYDYWFVQFDFPDENGRPYKSSGGKMVWNEKLKREIPKSWKVLSVNDISQSFRGVSYTKGDLTNENQGVLVLRGNNIQDNKLIYDSNVAYIPQSFVSIEQKICKGDIIMTMSSGSKEHIGKCVLFHHNACETYGAFLTKFSPHPHSHCSFILYNVFNSAYFKAKIKSIASGTGINNLTNQTFDNIYIALPPMEILKEFDELQNEIFSEVGVLQQDTWHLTKQRDELLPLLMNGQVSVNSDLSHG